MGRYEVFVTYVQERRVHIIQFLPLYLAEAPHAPVIDPHLTVRSSPCSRPL